MTEAKERQLIRYTAKTTQDVQGAIAEAIVQDFADWADDQGYEIVWAAREGMTEPAEWDYTSLAAAYVEQKQED